MAGEDNTLTAILDQNAKNLSLVLEGCKIGNIHVTHIHPCCCTCARHGCGNGNCGNQGNGCGDDGGNDGCGCGNGCWSDKGQFEITLLGSSKNDKYYDIIRTDCGFLAAGVTGNSYLFALYSTDLDLETQHVIHFRGDYGKGLGRLARGADGRYMMVGTSGGATSASGSIYTVPNLTLLDESAREALLVSEYGSVTNTSGSAGNLDGLAAVPADFTGTARYIAWGWDRTNINAQIISLDRDMNLLWQTSVGSNSEEYFRDVLIERDAVVAAGWSGTSGLLTHFDDALHVTQNILIGSGTRFYCILKNPDGYVLGGHLTNSVTGLNDLLLVALDDNMHILRTAVLSCDGASHRLTAMSLDRNGHLVLTGNVTGIGSGSTDVFVVAVDPAFCLTKQLVFGGAGDENSSYSLLVEEDGSYVIAGGTESAGAGGSDAFVARIRGDFSRLDGPVAKYPSLRINCKPGYVSKQNVNLTYNDNPGLTQTPLSKDLIQRSFTPENPSSLAVDPNAVR